MLWLALGITVFALAVWCHWYFGVEEIDCEERRWLVRRIRDKRPLSYGVKFLTIHKYTRKGPRYVCADNCQTPNVTHHYADGRVEIGRAKARESEGENG